MVSLEKVFNAQLAKRERVEDLQNGLQSAAASERNGLAGVERGEGEISLLEVVSYVTAAFVVIVMFSLTVIYFTSKLSGGMRMF